MNSFPNRSGKIVCQNRKLPLCPHSSRAAFTDRQNWWFPAIAGTGRLPCSDKVCSIVLPQFPVWPVSICTAAGRRCRRQQLLLWRSSHLSPSSATTRKASPVLLPRPVPALFHLIQHLLFHSQNVWADSPVAQREPRKAVLPHTGVSQLSLNSSSKASLCIINFTCSKHQP